MYIDPGTGSYVLQVIVASFVGAVALFWHRVVSFFRNLFGKKPDGSDG